MISALLVCLLGYSAPESNDEIIFAAERISVPDGKTVVVNERSQLYRFDLQTLESTPLIQSSQQLSFPTALGDGKIAYLSHDKKTGDNTLIGYDLKSQKRIARVPLWSGEVEEVEAVGSGRYLLVKYQGEVDESQDDLIERLFRQVLILKDMAVWKKYWEESDVAIDPRNERVGTVAKTGEISFDPPLRDGLAKTDLATYGKARLLNFGEDRFLAYSSEFVEDSLRLQFHLFTDELVKSISQPKHSAQAEDREFEWFLFDIGYPSKVFYSERESRFLFVGGHGMSDGIHWMSMTVDFDSAELDPIGAGIYVGRDDRERVVLLDRTWIGEYKRGGIRAGYLCWLMSGMEGRHSLTSDEFNVTGACWLRK